MLLLKCSRACVRQSDLKSHASFIHSCSSTFTFSTPCVPFAFRDIKWCEEATVTVDLSSLLDARGCLFGSNSSREIHAVSTLVVFCRLNFNNFLSPETGSIETEKTTNRRRKRVSCFETFFEYFIYKVLLFENSISRRFSGC